MNVNTFLSKTLLVVWCAIALFATTSQVRAESGSLADDPTFNAIMDSGKKFYRPWDKNRDPKTADPVPDYVQEYEDEWTMKNALAAPIFEMVYSGQMTMEEASEKIQAVWAENGLDY